jgi:molybdenum cofactor synthesis domain-containing protein
MNESTATGSGKTRPFKALIPYEIAQEQVLKSLQPLVGTEKVPIDQALGRIVAGDIVAPIDVAPFDRAAMDGYAVRAEDTYGASDLAPKSLKCIGAVYAGDNTDLSIDNGQCIKIATGAMLPSGADGVVMVEYTEDTPEGILIHRPIHPGENSSKKGSDIKLGSLALSTGMELSPARIGVAAALGIEDLEVFVRPKVAISATGNEVCPLGKELRPGQVFDINTYTLSSVVTSSGGEPMVLGLMEDTREALDEAFKKALGAADLVVFSGGSSVGERDLLIDVFSDYGNVLFHGVQLKPGKPVLAAVCDNTLCFGLPGYPTSCLTSALLFLAPSVRKLANLPALWPKTIHAKLARRIPSTLGRTQVLTVKLEKDFANPAFKESGAITSMAEADGYIIIPSNVDLLEKDEDTQVFLF